MLALPEELILFDTEYTAWEDSKETQWGGPNEYREIIQIGAIRVHGLTETASFMRFVKPVKNPQLSGFIIGLTGISQADVEQGDSFSDAYTAFLAFVGATPTFCWGSDVEVFDQNGELSGDTRRLPREQFMNLKPSVVPLLTQRGIDESMYSSGTLLTAFNLPEARRAHDAVNDMRNLLDALRELAR